MTRLGQHFITNTGAIQTMVAALTLEPGDTIIEIGPGRGVLTDGLRIKNSEVKIISIEKDRALAQFLKKLYAGESRIEIIEGDALRILSTLVLKLKIKDWKLIGNIPYYITGKLLRTLGEIEQKPKVAILTIQREVAERLVAAPPHMNLLAAATQVWTEPTILRFLKPGDFSPPPAVQSAIIKLVTKKEIIGKKEMESYYRLIKVLFRQPRKTIWNNLRVGLPHDALMLQKTLLAHGFSENARPQDVSLEVLIKLATSLG